MSSSGSSRRSFSPPPPSETFAPPPYTSPCDAHTNDRMISPDNAINSLLDENLPVLMEQRKNTEKIPFPGNTAAATQANSKLPRYSEIEELSPTENDLAEIPPVYPGNFSEFVQHPTPSNNLQTVRPVIMYMC